MVKGAEMEGFQSSAYGLIHQTYYTLVNPADVILCLELNKVE